MNYKEFLNMRGITPTAAKAPDYGAMKKAALIEAAKQKGVYTGEMDKPSTSKAEIIKALLAADTAALPAAGGVNTGDQE
jgi:hypothetical protein